MTARRVRLRSLPISIEALAEREPTFAALAAVLLGMGWARTKTTGLRRRRDGRLSGRIVWRKGSKSVVWCASFQHEGRSGR